MDRLCMQHTTHISVHGSPLHATHNTHLGSWIASACNTQHTSRFMDRLCMQHTTHISVHGSPLHTTHTHTQHTSWFMDRLCRHNTHNTHLGSWIASVYNT